AAREADQTHVRVGNQLVAEILREARDHLHPLGRQARLEEQFADAQHRKRTVFGQLDDDRCARCKRARDLVREEFRRIVDRDDADDDAHRLTDGEGEHAFETGHAVHRQVVATDALGLFRKVGEQTLRRDEFGPALSDRLAVLAGQELAQLLQLLPDELRRPAQDIAASMGRQCRHDTATLSGPVKRLPDVLDTGLRDGVNRLSGGGVPHDIGLARDRADPLAANQHLHLIPPVPGYPSWVKPGRQILMSDSSKLSSRLYKICTYRFGTSGATGGGSCWAGELAGLRYTRDPWLSGRITPPSTGRSTTPSKPASSRVSTSGDSGCPASRSSGASSVPRASP